MIFWMIGICPVRTAPVSSQRSFLSLLNREDVFIEQAAGSEKPLPSLYRLDCWYLVLRHNLDIYDPDNVLGLWSATQRVHPQPNRRTALESSVTSG